MTTDVLTRADRRGMPISLIRLIRSSPGDLKMIICIILFAIVMPGVALCDDRAAVRNDDGVVLGAAISATRRLSPKGWLLVADHTAAFPCDASPSDLVQIGGCSGMRTKDQTPEQVLAQIKAVLPDVSDEALSDLRAKNAASVVVHKALPIPPKQIFWGPKTGRPIPTGLGTPELALVFSRVGVNRTRTDAVAYIGGISWTDPTLSFGEYVHLRLQGGTWSLRGKYRNWELAH